MLPEDFSASQEEISCQCRKNIIYVQVLENCQGLFPGNTDSATRLGQAFFRIQLHVYLAGDHGGVYRKRETVQGVCVQVLYRGDAVSDCNIVRNTYSRITLRLTGDSMTDYEWNVRNGVKAPEIGFIAAGESGTVSYSDRQGELIGIKVGDCTWRDMVYAGGRYVMVGDEAVWPVLRTENHGRWRMPVMRIGWGLPMGTGNMSQ